jgi:hypothetical protein
MRKDNRSAVRLALPEPKISAHTQEPKGAIAIGAIGGIRSMLQQTPGRPDSNCNAQTQAS